MLKISNLSFSYQNQDIFTQANLVVSNPEKIAIIGDNGTGKSTLLHLIAGELHPDDGSIKVDGTVGLLPQTGDTSMQSGGERTRRELAQLFARNYDVLLLDEPTNNLDASNINWLVSQLQRYQGLALIVSHDRDFMNQVADRIVELKSGQLQDYAGNYHDYTSRQQQLRDQALFNYHQATKTKATLRARINHAQTHIKVKNRPFDKIKDENRMAFKLKRNNSEAVSGKIIRSARTQLAKLDAVQKPEVHKVYRANLPVSFLRQGRLLLVQDLAKSYHEKIIFQHLNFELYAGNRCQVSGDNGSGKTTLFRIIMGEEIPTYGVVQLRNNIRIGYIAQTTFGLDLNRNFLSQTAANATEVFQAAATMDFRPHDLQKPVHQLSRGQLTKLAFLKVMLTPVDLLILDEPTNHLDIRARENIEQALANYPGAILFATHDQTFAQALSESSHHELQQINLKH